MAKYVIDEKTLTDIAESIRMKKGTTAEITPEDMPSEIAGITGGGEAEDLDAVLTEQEELITTLQTILNLKAGEGNYTIENWIFTLEDGTTVEKAVIVNA